MSGFDDDAFDHEPVVEGGPAPKGPVEAVVKNVKELANGFELIEPAKEVEMAESAKAAEPVEANHNDTLWTWKITACCVIATYDHKTGKRTLVHLKGSDAESSYFDALAKMISETTTVIIASGTDTGSKEGFEATVSDNHTESIKEAMKRAGKDASKLLFRVYHTTEADDRKDGVEPGTFAITAKGKYGRTQNS